MIIVHVNRRSLSSDKLKQTSPAAKPKERLDQTFNIGNRAILVTHETGSCYFRPLALRHCLSTVLPFRFIFLVDFVFFLFMEDNADIGAYVFT